MFSGQIDSLYLFLPFYCGSFVLGCQTLSKQIECFIFFFKRVISAMTWSKPKLNNFVSANYVPNAGTIGKTSKTASELLWKNMNILYFLQTKAKIMGKDLEQTFPLSVSLSWSTDLGSRSVAPLSRSQKGRVVRSQSLARDDWGRDTENLRAVVVEKKWEKIDKNKW